jgi:hypothetical protein
MPLPSHDHGSRRAAVLHSLAARPRLCKYRSEHAGQQFQGVAAEDLVDAVRREAAIAQQANQVVELVIAGQDRAVVSVQVGADGYVVRAGRLGQPDDLGAEVREGPAGDPQGQAPTRPPASATAAACCTLISRGCAMPG